MQYHRSNRSERLVHVLAELLARPADPLVPDTVVVHSRGLERWLSMQLAQRLGVCASVDFRFPDEVLADAISAALGPETDLLAWSADRLAFTVRAALDPLLADPRFQTVQRWTLADGSACQGRRLTQLSVRLGALFERYAVYRPDEVVRWTPDAPDWQEALYATVRERLGDDPARLADRFVAALPDLDPGILPGGRLALFSVSALPPLFVRLFGCLGTLRQVHLLTLCPTPYPVAGREAAVEPTSSGSATSDIPRRALPPSRGPSIASRRWTSELEASHPLLDSLGATHRGFHDAIRTLCPGLEARDHFDEPADDSILRALQRDLLAGSLGPRTRTFAPARPSIRLHACHSLARQVEVLRDVLIELLDADPTLQPRDILVLAPDIETFAPLVEATFDDGAPWSRRDEHPGGLPRLPWHLADRGPAATNPAAAALLDALELLSGRLEASRILDLLASGPVCAHLGLVREELLRLRDLVAESGARWGADADHRVGEGLPAAEVFTWRHALDRLALGQAVRECEGLVLDRVPCGDIEGKDARASLGALLDFVEGLLELRLTFAEPAPLPVWQERLLDLLHRLVGDRDPWAHRVRRRLDDLVGEGRRAGCDGPWDLPAVRALLEGRFQVREPGPGWLAGGITLAELVPMRSIPFRVLCLLGMDDGAFPRAGRPDALDRMRQAPRPADRSVREDDRALFLEALLSARDRLEILYTGRGIRDDRVRPPAAPVSELLDVLDRSFTTGTDLPLSRHITVRHPLQPFDPRVFRPPAEGGAASIRGYDRRDCEAARAWLSAAPHEPRPFLTEPLPAPELSSLALDDLIRFVQHPSAWFASRVLGIWIRDDEDPVLDREPIGLPSGLEAWILRDRLVRALLAGRSLDEDGEVFHELHGAGLLPLGTPGRLAFQQAREEAAELVRRYQLHCAGEVTVKPIRVQVAGVLVHGAVPGCTPGGHVTWRAGSLRPKAVIDLWVRHLALCASGHPGLSCEVGRGGTVGFTPVEDALERLAELVHLFRVGHQTPLVFFPACSERWLRHYDDPGTWEDGTPRDPAQHAWFQCCSLWGGFDEPGPVGPILFGARSPLEADAPQPPIVDGLDRVAVARRIYAPLWAHREAL